MIDLNQLKEECFKSAFRRFPNSSSNDVIQKIFEEAQELEDASLNNFWKSCHCSELMAVEEELADVILDCLTFAKCENIDIERALIIKNEFNKTRK